MGGEGSSMGMIISIRNNLALRPRNTFRSRRKEMVHSHQVLEESGYQYKRLSKVEYESMKQEVRRRIRRKNILYFSVMLWAITIVCILITYFVF